ncbi:MAG: pitrilysin family protein [Candidatus Eisenbacteria bacterium]|nr:pitrilysin family protein [Candidatus Eisenbacteria bacterium]
MTMNRMARHATGSVAATALLAAFLATPTSAISPVKSWKDVKIAPLEWKKPTPTTITLKNGTTVYLMEDHRLPLISFYGVVRTGSLYDPPGKAGTASLVGTMLRTGGTTKRPWDKLDAEVDRLAMAVTTGVGTENGNATFQVLTENFDPALNLLFEMLREPAFDAEKLALAKEKIKDGIRRQNDNPVQIALRELPRRLYGENHPRGFAPTFATVDAVTRKDLVDFHKKYYVPSNLMIGIAGDFDAATVAATIEAAMGNWPDAAVTLPTVPAIQGHQPKAMFQADKTSATQSTILVTRLTTKVGEPDAVPLEVMDFILGSGGFTSRIVEAVRSDEGLAYASGSALQLGNIDPGPMIVYAISKGESTVKALEIMLREIARMRDVPVSDAELTKAVNALLNGEIFNYDQSDEIIANTLDLAYYGLPQDLPSKRLAQLTRVTAADVQAMAVKYLPENQLQILVVGSASNFDKPLSSLGPVTAIELKDPTAP